MAMNRVVLEYPKGVSLNVEVVDASGQPTRTVELSQPVLIRLGPGLEFLSVSSGNIKTLLNISGSDSDEEEDDDDGNGDSIEDMDADTTIDLVTEDEDNDDEDNDDEDNDDEDDEDDTVVVTFTADS